METLSNSITVLLIQVLLWRTAAFALSWAGWTPTAIRNTVATGVTNDLFIGLPLKRIEAKLQRKVYVMQPLQMASVEGSAEHAD
jgi:hypothetical protein